MEGRAEERAALALKMLRAGKADDEILEFTELTKEALNSLKEQGDHRQRDSRIHRATHIKGRKP